MKRNEIEGKWNQFKGQVKQGWGKLTRNKTLSDEGKQEQLSGKLRQRFGNGQTHAENEVKIFLTSSKKSEHTDGHMKP